MKKLLTILVLFFATQSFAAAGGLVDRVSDVCPESHMYVNYALYNAEDYFWIFKADKTTVKPTKSIVTLVNPNNKEQFLLAVFSKKTVFGWTNVGGMTAGAARYQSDFKKAVDAGWTLCSRSTTDLGIKQLEYILKNGAMDSSLSNK